MRTAKGLANKGLANKGLSKGTSLKKLKKDTPLYRCLEEYLRREIIPFHMPGHKGRPEFLTCAKTPAEWLKFDLTELAETDNLHRPTGAIAATGRNIAEIYGGGSCKSYLLTNGSTAGIVAAIAAVCEDGEPLCAARNSHRAVHSGMVVSGAVPLWLMEVSAASVQNMLEQNPACKAVVITSPTYEGFVGDIAAIAEITRRHRAVLIVDEAHGAHFPFSGYFPQPAITLGADIVINSLHKTLPAISGCAVLHIKNGLAELLPRLENALQITQSTSPSFMLMASVDFMLGKLLAEPWHFEEYVENLAALRHELSRNKNFRLVEPDGFYDRGKILFTVNGGGKALAERMLQEHRIQPEMATDTQILCMTSVADTKEAFARLAEAAHALDKRLAGIGVPPQGIPKMPVSPTPPVSSTPPASPALPVPIAAMSPREAFRAKSRKVAVRDAAGTDAIDTGACGKISAEFFAPYPPGIPVIAPGEVITAGVLDVLMAAGIGCIGCVEDKTSTGYTL